MAMNSKGPDQTSLPPGKIAQYLFRITVGEEKMVDLKLGHSLKQRIYNSKSQDQFKIMAVFNDEMEKTGYLIRRTA